MSSIDVWKNSYNEAMAENQRLQAEHEQYREWAAGQIEQAKADLQWWKEEVLRLNAESRAWRPGRV